MKRFLVIVGIVVLVLAGFFVFRLVFGGSEDSYVCENGTFVAHGAPSGPVPSGVCEISESFPAASPAINFSRTGNISKHENDSAWYFVYEEQGNPALLVKLILSASDAQRVRAGLRVQIDGYESEGIVSVYSLSESE